MTLNVKSERRRLWGQLKEELDMLARLQDRINAAYAVGPCEIMNEIIDGAKQDIDRRMDRVLVIRDQLRELRS